MTVYLSKAKVGDVAHFRCGGSAAIVEIDDGDDCGTCKIAFSEGQNPFTYLNNGALQIYNDRPDVKEENPLDIVKITKPKKAHLYPDIVEYTLAFNTRFFGGYSSEINARHDAAKYRDRHFIGIVKVTLNPNTKEVKAEVVK